jgi:hypothetical protein
MSMGLIDNLARGISEGAGTAAMGFMERFKSEVEQERQDALMRVKQGIDQQNTTFNEGVRREGRQADVTQDIANAPALRNVKTEDAKATAQARIDVEFSPENTDKKIAQLQALGPAEAKIKTDAAVADMLAKSTPEALGAARKIAAATRDPLQQKLLGVQIEQAALGLEEGKTQAGERGQVRGLVDAARASGDSGMPGADEAKKFYLGKAGEANKGAQMARGVDVDKAERHDLLEAAKAKYNLAEREMDDTIKGRLIADADALVKRATGGSDEKAGGAATPPAMSDRVKGQIYKTPKGDMEWTGDGWKPAKAVPAKPDGDKPVDDGAVRAQREWGMLTPDAMVKRGVELGIKGAIAESEARARRFKPQTGINPMTSQPY